MNLNILLSNYTVSASAVTTPEIECEYGDVVCFDVLVESVSGAPTSATLACKFQLGPIEFHGYNINSDTSGVPRPWIDVVPSDTYTGHLLVDGDWPTTLATQTLSATRLVSRRLTIPALGNLVKLVLTPTFNGGTSPTFNVTVACATATLAPR